ncbi:MAG: hypothetical protein ACI965_000341 [Paraglaciecola sp.]|jgi:hypothetical protein
MVRIAIIVTLCTFTLACGSGNIFQTWQTSASLLMKHSQQGVSEASAEEKPEALKKNLLMQDMYIKASSYAIINKVFFFLSIISAIAVFLWPALSIVFKHKWENSDWLKSATVQTTVTAIAALMFTFYSQYKDKQTHTENLMRYVIYAEQPASQLSLKVSEELAGIDRGFSFDSIVNKAKRD